MHVAMWLLFFEEVAGKVQDHMYEPHAVLAVSHAQTGRIAFEACECYRALPFESNSDWDVEMSTQHHGRGCFHSVPGLCSTIGPPRQFRLEATPPADPRQLSWQAIDLQTLLGIARTYWTYTVHPELLSR